MKSKIEENKKNEVIDYLKEGKTEKEIGELLGGFKYYEVHKFIEKYNLGKYRNKSRPRESSIAPSVKVDWKDEKNLELLNKLYFEDKLSQEEIGKVFGVAQRTIAGVIKRLGLTRKSIMKIFEDRVCPICKKVFTPKYRDQIYCSVECSSKSENREKKILISSKDEFIKILEKNNWNYRKTGKDLGVSDTAIRKLAKKYEIYKYKQKDWSDVVDLESAQRKIDELGIKTPTELYDYYGGLRDRVDKLNLRHLLKYPGLGNFDSSWEERMYTLIQDSNISYTFLEHNIILDPECKYINSLIFDIVLEYPDSHKAVIEIQGPTHFRNIYEESYETVKQRDEIKYEYCVSHGIDLYYFTYEPKLLEDYGYPHYVYTDENLLLEKLKSYSSSITSS